MAEDIVATENILPVDEEQKVENSIQQDSSVASDVTIDIPEGAQERPKLQKQSSSLVEIVVENPPAPDDDTLVDKDEGSKSNLRERVERLKKQKAQRTAGEEVISDKAGDVTEQKLPLKDRLERLRKQKSQKAADLEKAEEAKEQQVEEKENVETPARDEVAGSKTNLQERLQRLKKQRANKDVTKESQDQKSSEEIALSLESIENKDAEEGQGSKTNLQERLEKLKKQRAQKMAGETAESNESPRGSPVPPAEEKTEKKEDLKERLQRLKKQKADKGGDEKHLESPRVSPVPVEQTKETKEHLKERLERLKRQKDEKAGNLKEPESQDEEKSKEPLQDRLKRLKMQRSQKTANEEDKQVGDIFEETSNKTGRPSSAPSSREIKRTKKRNRPESAQIYNPRLPASSEQQFYKIQKPSEELKEIPQLDENQNEINFVLEEDEDETPKRSKKDSYIVPSLENEDELPWAMYAKQKNRREEVLEEDDLESESADSESGDENYAPSTNEDLPDLYDVMDSLDTEDIHLNLKTAPPNMFENEEQKIFHKHVQDLRQGLAEEEIKVYLDEFEERVEQEILMIGNISLEDVQEEEHRLREEHITFQQQQAVVQRQRQQEIMEAMERAKKYVMSKYKEKYRELRMREEHLMQKDRSYKDEIHRAFRRSESQLRKALRRRKAEVKTMYGDLTFADGQYGGSKGRRWKIDWNRTPQPIQIKLKCLRGVKDKLPASRYVLMVSLYNRLGGTVMKWSNLKGQQWGGATLPIWHDGEFFNIEMKIDQSVFTVCPSRPDMRPGMVLVFELFILRGPVTPTDKVVGWGCFPVCDAEFNVIEGKYKTPLLRGDMDPAVDKFEIMEKLMADDLEHWLCNFYFEIVKLPRYMAGQKEYEVELQFTSGLLGAPDRTKTKEENIDGEKAIFGSRSDMGSPAFSHSSRTDSIVSAGREADESSSALTEKPPMLVVDQPESSSGGSSSKRKVSLTNSQIQMFRAETLTADLYKKKRSVSTVDDPAEFRPLTSVEASRALVEEKGLQLSDDESEKSDYDEKDIYKLKENEGFKPVKGQPGMFYKIHHNTPSDVYARKVYTMMPKTPLLAKERAKKKLTHLEQLDIHSYSVKAQWSNKGRMDRKGSRKMQYMGRMFLSEVGLSQVKTREFWAMILMILIVYWMRLYCHYIGQWITLLGFGVPINKFEFLPYTVNLNYQNTLLRTREEIALVVLGPFTIILLLIVMVLISAFIQFLFDRFPNVFSRFIMAFGLHCFLDPIWIVITDSVLQRYKNKGGDFPIGDAFKLYWHFDRFYNNDNVTLFVSIALTVFLYFVTMFCTAVILYMYFLRIHNNGRLMDVYWRLHGADESFFLPYDLEVSHEELSYVCRKAENWRGEEGERRKTAVYDYIWEEEEMADGNWDNPEEAHGHKTGAKEVTTHVSIHTLHLDGLRELYRHFLRLPDGAIVEVFGEMNIPGIDEGVKQALIKRTTFQTTDGLRKRRPSRMSSATSLPRGSYDILHVGNNLEVPGTGMV